MEASPTVSSGVASSSVIATPASLMVRPAAVACTVSVSSASSRASAVGVSVKVLLPLERPAAIVMSKASTLA